MPIRKGMLLQGFLNLDVILLKVETLFVAPKRNMTPGKSENFGIFQDYVLRCPRNSTLRTIGVLTIYMGKPEIPGWRSNAFAPFGLGRKLQKTWTVIWGDAISFSQFGWAFLDMLCNGSFSHHVKFYSFSLCTRFSSGWFVQMVSTPSYDGHSYITDGPFCLFPSIVLFLKMPTKWERNVCVCLILHRLLIDTSVCTFIFRSPFFLWKFLLVESGILGFGFRNSAQGMARFHW